MAKVPEEMVHQTTRRAIEATNFGVNWLREMAEQNMGQTKNAVESLSYGHSQGRRWPESSRGDYSAAVSVAGGKNPVKHP